MVEQSALPDYDDHFYLEEEDNGQNEDPNANGTQVAAGAKPAPFVGVHATSFKDMLLKPELQHAIVDCGFEHPSDVQ
jgi:ATP-dependent RNA helicase UAP56/SUB2